MVQRINWPLRRDTDAPQTNSEGGHRVPEANSGCPAWRSTCTAAANSRRPPHGAACTKYVLRSRVNQCRRDDHCRDVPGSECAQLDVAHFVEPLAKLQLDSEGLRRTAETVEDAFGRAAASNKRSPKGGAPERS